MQPALPPPPIALLGAPTALARSMAHALRQAWLQHHGTGSDWPCLAPEPDEPLPRELAIYLLGLDWQTHQDADTGPAAQHRRWRGRLQAGAHDYVVLYGSPARQWQQLADSLRARAPGTDWSWLPASPAQRSARLRPMGCEQCSDPDCERRLFDALKSSAP